MLLFEKFHQQFLNFGSFRFLTAYEVLKNLFIVRCDIGYKTDVISHDFATTHLPAGKYSFCDRIIGYHYGLFVTYILFDLVVKGYQ